MDSPFRSARALLRRLWRRLKRFLGWPVGAALRPPAGPPPILGAGCRLAWVEPNGALVFDVPVVTPYGREWVRCLSTPRRGIVVGVSRPWKHAYYTLDSMD